MSVVETFATALLVEHAPRAGMALERLPAAQAAAVLQTLTTMHAAAVLREMTPPRAADTLALLAPEEASAILAATPANDAARIARALDAARRDAIVSGMPEADREVLLRVLRFPEGTAGAEMDPSVFQVFDDVLVSEARDRLRRAARDLLYYIYVVAHDGTLIGVLDIPELMLASARRQIGAAMHRDPERVSAWMPVALVREHPGWHRYHAMPVVDESNRFLGAIRYQTLRRLEREAVGRGEDPAMVTARALGDLFRVGTAGLVAGVATAGGAAAETDDGR